ncbi:MAG: type II toxin-antitoxin system RelE/ParE family toxin [Pseudomonadota bacterium]
MRELRLTQTALKDFEAIRSYTLETYGQNQLSAYSSLIDQALEDLRLDPLRAGSKHRPEVDPKTRSYRISLSVDRAGVDVKNPRHLIFYFQERDDALVVTRILHEAMDHKRHVSKSKKDFEFEVQNRDGPSRGRSL